MHLTKQIQIKKSDPRYGVLDGVCFKSKNLYNVGMYRVKKHYEENKEYLNYHSLYKILAEEDQVDYRALPQNVAAQTLMSLDRVWKSYFLALRTYKKNPKKFSGKPREPKFLHKTDGRFVATYTQRAIQKKPFKKEIIQLTGLDCQFNSFGFQKEDIQQIRIVPKDGFYNVEIVYKVECDEPIVSDNHCGIDLGLNNLATLGFNNPDIKPLIVNGKGIKSTNQYYNKKRAKIVSKLNLDKKRSSKALKRLTKKRNNKVKNDLHKASREIVDYLKKNNISTVVIGHNKGWKDEINIGKRNNQNFVGVPHSQLIDYIKYKCILVGITTITREESYTSKCSFLDGEKIRKKKSYKGKRIKRGLFKSANGTLYNADLNGALNILRKESPSSFDEGVEDLVVDPVKINLAFS